MSKQAKTPAPDRLPPHNLDAEAAVLSCWLQDAGLASAACNGTTPEAFYDLRNRAIFKALKSLPPEGADLVLLQQMLIQTGKLQEAGGIQYLATVQDAAPSPANVSRYVDIVREMFLRRRVVQTATEAANRAYNLEGSIDELLWATLSDIKKLDAEPPSSAWDELVEDGAFIMQETLPPAVEIIEGLLTEQSKFVIGSGSKSYKTWLTLDAAISIACGVSFLGRATIKSRVLYVNLELKPSTFKRRLQVVARARGVTLEAGWVSHLPLRGKIAGLTAAEIISRIIAEAQCLNVKVVIIDPVYKINTEGDENSAHDQTRLFNEIDRLTTEAEATVILNDHFGKGNQSEKDPLDAIRGSSAKGGDLDAAMVIRRHEVENAFRVDIVHRELPPVEPFVIGWECPIMVLRDDLSPDDMKKAKAGRKSAHDPKDLLAALNGTTAENGISISAWAKAINLPRETLRPYLNKFRAKGWISTVGEGNSARQFLTDTGHKYLENEQ